MNVRSARHVRLALAAVGVAALLPTGLAGAAPDARSCNLLTDPAADTAVPASGSVDIVSADVASDGKTVTAVLRVADYTTPDAAAVIGRAYVVAFSGAGLRDMYLIARDGRDQLEPFGYGSGITERARIGAATGSINAARGEIRISVPARTLKAAHLGTLRKGGALNKISAFTSVLRASTPQHGDLPSQPTDDGTTTRRYVVGSPSCVQV